MIKTATEDARLVPSVMTLGFFVPQRESQPKKNLDLKVKTGVQTILPPNIFDHEDRLRS
jgi:hypothetical protein